MSELRFPRRTKIDYYPEELQDRLLQAIEKITGISLIVISDNSTLWHFGLSALEVKNLGTELGLTKELSEDLLLMDVLNLIKDQ